MTSPDAHIVTSEIFAVILAAGESTRMGSPKSLLLLGEMTAIERCVDLFLGAGVTDIRVVTGAVVPEVMKRHLPSLPVEWVNNDGYRQGMFSSVCRGIATPKPFSTGFFLLPVDIPLVRRNTVSTLLERWHEHGNGISVLHPSFNSERGHPPLISTGLIPDILSWRGPDGLKGFLDSCGHPALDVPVFDEFIHRDMDTPAAYSKLALDLSRHDIPSPAECEAMISSRSLFRPDTAAHCRLVSKIAAYLTNRLFDAGQNDLDIQRITAAAMLHDIAKGERGHAEAGAKRLRRYGFTGISDIVASHIDLHVPDTGAPSEAHIVYLSDKLAKGDVVVSPAERYRRKQQRYADNPEALSAIRKRLSDAEAISQKIESVTGTPMHLLISDFLREACR